MRMWLVSLALLEGWLRQIAVKGARRVKPAVDRDHLPRDVIGIRGEEEGGQPADVIRAAEAGIRNVREHHLAEIIGEPAFGGLVDDEPGADRVAADAVLSVAGDDRRCQRQDSALGNRV